MPYQFIPYHILIVLSALTAAALGICGCRHRTAPGAIPFVAAMFVGALWSVANALELSALTLEHKLFWANIQYIAYSLVPVAWIVMALQLSEYERWIKKKNLLLLLVIPIITCCLVWTDPILGFMRYNIRLDSTGPFPVIAKEYGPWFWVHFAQAYFLNFCSLLLLFKTVLSKYAIYRTQAALLLAGTALIAVFNLAYIIGISPMSHDVSPIIFSASGLIIALGIFRYRLFDLVPIARNKVIEAMKNIVIVIDASDVVVDLNPAAVELFNTGGEQSLIGKPLHLLSEELASLIHLGDVPVQREVQFTQPKGSKCRCFEIQLSPVINNKGALMGCVIVMNDITELKQAQEDLYCEQRELAVMAERDRLTKDLHDNLGQIFSFAGIQIQAAQMERQRGNQELADQYLHRLSEIIEEAHQEMRNYVYNARMDEYRKNSMENLILHQISRFVDNSGYLARKDIVLDLGDCEFSVEVKMHIVNIVKEALNNILKHACATSVKISIDTGSEGHRLIIEDNGIGFSGGSLTPAKGSGSGLCIMDERARLLGGNMKIDSVPGQYTKIIVNFRIS